MTKTRSQTALNRPYAHIVGGVQPGFSPAPDCVKHEGIALTEEKEQTTAEQATALQKERVYGPGSFRFYAAMA